MRFIHAPSGKGAAALQAKLTQALQAGKSVLWLYSGGSNLPITVQIMDALPAELTSRLTLAPIDERYGPPGHRDSNVRQLLDAGFQPKQATFVHVLNGDDLEATARRYAVTLTRLLAVTGISIVQLGMGGDGHIAGVLPHTVAGNSQELVTSYRGPDYERITLTLPALLKLTSIFLFAYGDGKRLALEQLRDENLSPTDQPAQILKQHPDVSVYNDQLEKGS